MQTLKTFDFATIVCDGCARRIDSNFDGERLYDYAELTEWKLDNLGWTKVDEKDDDRWLCPECSKDEKHRSHPGEGRVIVEKTPLFGLRCDLCGRTFEDFDGFSCWADDGIAEELAGDEEWQKIDGKWYCSDCYCTCPAMQDENEANYEEKYCKKCPYENDCGEVVPLDKPNPSSECKYAFKGEDGNWKRCPHYGDSQVLPEKCCIIANGGGECPRVAYWRDRGIAEQEAKNAKVREECHLKQKED